ncbi:aromatic-L-amino-acid decarboxylase-like [Penaeus indicus]|uniref:aromatic-L-amino-acid decarboxylase-like n=1 Tax=Penaeus indicus TaxID=29960 RepID=UPI00300C370F
MIELPSSPVALLHASSTCTIIFYLYCFQVTHWPSPQFHAYFPVANSYPSLLADMLCGAIGCIGFSWNSSPACTELEVVMMDWLGQLLDLPKEFLAASGGTGGGVIQGSASESTLVAMLSARSKITKTLEETFPDCDPSIVTKLVCYSSGGLFCCLVALSMLSFEL